MVHAIVGTLMMVGTASLIGLPIGVGAGIFASEWPGTRLAKATRFIADVMTYETGNTDGFLNGRQLADDVIDAELNLVTNGGIPSDCVANDSSLSSSWPFLAPPN